MWLQCCAWKESFDLGYVSRVYFVNLSTPLKHLEPPFCLSVARRGNAWAGLRIRGPRHLTPSEVTRTVISDIVSKYFHTCNLIYSPYCTERRNRANQLTSPGCLFVCFNSFRRSLNSFTIHHLFFCIYIFHLIF